MELMTVQEAAAALRVAPVTIRRYIAQGRLAAVKVGRAVRIDRESVENLPEPITAEAPDGPLPGELRYAKYLKGIPTSDDDPLWNIIGIAEGDEKEDVSGNKYRYLAEAYYPKPKE